MSVYLDKILSKNNYVYLFLLCFAFVIYMGVLEGPFFFDDNIFIEHNTYVQTFDVVKIYTSSTTAGSGLTGDNFYRPNGQLIYALIPIIFGAFSTVFHLVSIMLHSCVGFLVFLLFCLLGIDRRYSFLASLIFIVHPIQTQAISYISGLSEPLVAITTLGVLILFTQGLLKKNNFGIEKIILIILLSIVGFFSKESAVIVSPLMLLLGAYIYMQGRLNNLTRAIWVWLGVVAVSITYVVARFTALNFTHDLTGGFGLSTASNIYTESIYVRLVTFIGSLFNYPLMSLIPINLHYERPYFAYQTFLHPAVITGMVLILFTLFLVYSSVKKGKGVFFFGISWFIISILPVSGIIPTNAIYLEHWLYIPIVGFIFIFINFLQEQQGKNLLIYVTIIVLFIFAGMTIARNRDWADPIRFYKNELKYTEDSTRIYNNLAMEMANRGDCPGAIPYYYQAIFLNDSYPQTHHNLGMCLEEKGDFEGAILEYKKALAIDPNFTYSSRRLKVLFRGQ